MSDLPPHITAHIPPETYRLLTDQLFICLINKLGGTVSIPCATVDATGDFIVTIEADKDRNFILRTQKKN